MDEKLTLEGVDNYGLPKQSFADLLADADQAQYLQLAETYIWLSAYAANNPKSDYHWMVDALYAEAKRRGKLDWYDTAFKKASS